jgi:UDP-glucuronate decarboxylase
MTTLVTGGAGFLGSHLCTRLLPDGHDVVSLVNYFTSSCRNLGWSPQVPLEDGSRETVTYFRKALAQ